MTNLSDWYWIVGGATDKVFSSARTAYVSVTDDAYEAWIAAGKVATRIDTETNLSDVLARLGLSLTGRRRSALGYALISALTDPQVTALASAKPKDQRLLSARVDPWPEDNPKIARVAAVLGVTPAAWFDAALAPSA